MVPPILSSSEKQKSHYTQIYYERNCTNLCEDLHPYMLLLYGFFYQRMEIFIFFPEMSTEQWDLWCSIFHTQIILNKLIPVLPRTLNQCVSKTVESILEVQDFSGFVLSFLLLVTNKNLNIPLFHFAFNSVWDR